MKPYLTPAIVHPAGQVMTRKADKTGLISYQANKYSVPMAYQRACVGIAAEGQYLHILDRESGEEIARHALTTGKGKVIKNTHHYRDPAVRIEQLEQILQTLIGAASANTLSDLLKTSKPKIYKDQLAAVISLLKTHQPVSPALLEKLCQRPRLTATLVRDFLQAYQHHPGRLKPDGAPPAATKPGQLDAYGTLHAQEVSHVRH